MEALTHRKQGIWTDRDENLKKFLKGKFIFVGSTAVSLYDIKTTPVSRVMPGVTQQACIFDNLYQNNHHIQRLTPEQNEWILAGFCLLSAGIIWMVRSYLLGFLMTALMGLAFVFWNIWLFKTVFVWVNFVAPLMAQFLTVATVYSAKYFVRDKDFKAAYKLATTDALTGLHNRRFFEEFLSSTIQSAEKQSRKMSLLMVDIDFFKKFNDTYGHAAGDEVLRCVARKLAASVRTSDLVSRYGGEEMAIVLPKTNEQTALEIGQKLVKAIAATPYPIAAGVEKHVTISIGVATFPTHGKTQVDLFEFADQGLYRAKKNGRNQVGAQYDSPEEQAAAESQETGSVQVESSSAVATETSVPQASPSGSNSTKEDEGPIELEMIVPAVAPPPPPVTSAIPPLSRLFQAAGSPASSSALSSEQNDSTGLPSFTEKESSGHQLEAPSKRLRERLEKRSLY
jgi:diguanylate cyclase (GGDEF)-like protein